MQDPNSSAPNQADPSHSASGDADPNANSLAGSDDEFLDEELSDEELSDEELSDEELAELIAEAEQAGAESAESAQVAATRSPELYAASLANALAAARIADDLRGQDIVVLDLTAQTSIVDFFVIATGNSRRQMHAIADEVNRKLKREDGNRRFSIEGYRTEGNWILTDYGDVVLHVFTAEGRLLYNLEQLWADAKRIDWKSLSGSLSDSSSASASP